eukprot:gnl/Chilomastix_cuspidata/455.p1 GENE.gnl/Chilomastix_cuspidata/455~~gnl/Chilomastix_cuspidata/455.p1  ORF type:complete len:1159 (+),score=486.51 gnl/Chilomastix_cuspidata/455:114-3479(+)
MEAGSSSSSGDAFSSDVESSITISVRVRPETSEEREKNLSRIVKIFDHETLVFDPPPPIHFANPRYYSGKSDRRFLNMNFAFDNVFDESVTQQAVYIQTAGKLVPKFLEGYNCSVFAYGATGAGKTHTMIGTPSHGRGLMFLTLSDVFQRIEQDADAAHSLTLSFLEIYNEEILDLLSTGPHARKRARQLKLFEDHLTGVKVIGLSEIPVETFAEVEHLINLGSSNRTQFATDANASSSRSHAILSITHRAVPKDMGPGGAPVESQFTLIDLAGSERAAASKNSGERFKEGAHINKSLLALGNCINALFRQGQADAHTHIHVPYRESNLTRLLKQSLGGNSYTTMIANISPSSGAREDTLNTLQYANRAKQIRVKVRKNEAFPEDKKADFLKMIARLRAEVAALKKRLSASEGENDAKAAIRMMELVDQEETAHQEETVNSDPGVLGPDSSPSRPRTSVRNATFDQIRQALAKIDEPPTPTRGNARRRQNTFFSGAAQDAASLFGPRKPRGVAKDASVDVIVRTLSEIIREYRVERSERSEVEKFLRGYTSAGDQFIEMRSQILESRRLLKSLEREQYAIQHELESFERLQQTSGMLSSRELLVEAAPVGITAKRRRFQEIGNQLATLSHIQSDQESLAGQAEDALSQQRNHIEQRLTKDYLLGLVDLVSARYRDRLELIDLGIKNAFIADLVQELRDQLLTMKTETHNLFKLFTEMFSATRESIELGKRLAEAPGTPRAGDEGAPVRALDDPRVKAKNKLFKLKKRTETLFFEGMKSAQSAGVAVRVNSKKERGMLRTSSKEFVFGKPRRASRPHSRSNSQGAGLDLPTFGATGGGNFSPMELQEVTVNPESTDVTVSVLDEATPVHTITASNTPRKRAPLSGIERTNPSPLVASPDVRAMKPQPPAAPRPASQRRNVAGQSANPISRLDRETDRLLSERPVTPITPVITDRFTLIKPSGRYEGVVNRVPLQPAAALPPKKRRKRKKRVQKKASPYEVVQKPIARSVVRQRTRAKKRPSKEAAKLPYNLPVTNSLSHLNLEKKPPGEAPARLSSVQSDFQIAQAGLPDIADPPHIRFERVSIEEKFRRLRRDCMLLQPPAFAGPSFGRSSSVPTQASADS